MQFCCMNIQCVKEACVRQSRVNELYTSPMDMNIVTSIEFSHSLEAMRAHDE